MRISLTKIRKRILLLAILYLPILFISTIAISLPINIVLISVLRASNINPSSQYIALRGITNWINLIIIIGLTWTYLRLYKWKCYAEIGLPVNKSILWLPAGLLFSILCFVIATSIIKLLGATVIKEFSQADPWVIFTSIAIATLAGWGEEIAYRGVLLQSLEEALNRPLAVIISTLLFVLLHAFLPSSNNIVYWSSIFLFSLTLTGAYYLTGCSLWLPVGLHWGTDLWVCILELLGEEVAGIWIMGASYRIWLPIIALPFIWLILIALWILSRRSSDR
jgi:membrane protease YdiL (CAAX protease family)